MPVVSIIIPTLNRSKYLRGSIESARNQTFTDFEIIVVDDSLDDSTYRVIESLDDDRIVYIKNSTRKGVSFARNLGITAASGDFIGFLDDDDWWHPSKLEKQLEVAREEGTTFIYCGHDYINIDGALIKRIRGNIKGQVFGKLLESNLIGLSTALVKKVCFDEVGYFDEELHLLEDWDLWIRIAKQYEFGSVDEQLVKNLIHSSQLTSDMIGMVNFREILIKRYEEEMSPSILAKHYHWIGVNHFLYGDLKKGVEYENMAISIAPDVGLYRRTRLAFKLGRKIVKFYLKATGNIYEKKNDRSHFR